MVKSKLFDEDVEVGDGWFGCGNFVNNGDDDENKLDSATDFMCSLIWLIFMVAFCFSSSRKLILNQFDRRPNFEPPFDIPT